MTQTDPDSWVHRTPRDSPLLPRPGRGKSDHSLLLPSPGQRRGEAEGAPGAGSNLSVTAEMTVAMPCIAAVGFPRPLTAPWRGKSVRLPRAKCKHAEHPGSLPLGAFSRCRPGSRSKAPKLNGAWRAGVLVPLWAGGERKKESQPSVPTGIVWCTGRCQHGADRNQVTPMGLRGANPVVSGCVRLCFLPARACVPLGSATRSGRSFCILS